MGICRAEAAGSADDSESRSANVQAGDGASDHETLDLGGALEDRVGALDPSSAFVQPLPMPVRVRRFALNPASFDAL
jgi:hypothetical protein